MGLIRLSLAAAGAALALGSFSGASAGQLAKAEPSVDYKVVDDAISAPLTGKAGDPGNGRKVAINRKKGNCLACHAMPVPEQQFHGEVGPSLEGVGDRYTADELRLRLVDSKVLNPDTIMPSFYKTSGLNRVMKKFEGKTILSAQEVEDVVAYLVTLK